MSALAFRPFDADNHYYEALDAFTRHLDPKHGSRIIQWCDINGRKYPVIAGKVFRGVTNATFDPVAEPGCLSRYFRGNPDGAAPLELLKARNPIRADYRDRDARLAVMDGQGLERVWMFPTLGMIYEEPLRHDPEGVTIMFEAFNRWLDEDWGFAYQDRIFAAPYVPLVDVGWACRELEWAIGRGARTIVMRPAAPTTAAGPMSPAAAMFDPFWARVNEAGITVVVHAGDAGNTSHGYARDGFTTDFGGIPQPVKMLQLERPIEDFLASLVADKLFERFPNLRIASVENGSGFLAGLLHRLTVVGRKMTGWFAEDPADTFRRHIWMNPFWEDDLDDLVSLVGTDRVIFGSDWPHIEALPEPLDYVDEVAHLTDVDQRLILLDNTAALTRLHPAR